MGKPEVDVPSPRDQRSASHALLLVLYHEAAAAAELLRRLANDRYEVVVCPLSSLEGCFRGELPMDLILLMSPDDDTRLIDTCQALRSQTACPLVVLSTRSDDLLIAAALDTGVDECLVLPIGDRELSARIGALLRRARGRSATGERKEIGGLVLSPADLSVELADRKVLLTPLEFRLLSCLVSAPGKVFTHQALMSRVWGAEYVDSRHYLHLYVRYLREKLEEDPRCPRLILNEWGVGYRFEPAELAAR